VRRVRYSVAMSLDGYIAGSNGEADWIVRDPDIDFAAMFQEFDTFLIGRKTYEAMQAYKGGGLGAAKVFVTQRDPIRSGLEMLAVGGLAGAVAYVVGAFLSGIAG